MTLRELYPYWSDEHDEIVERLQWLRPPQWDEKPAHAQAGSIRQIVAAAIRHERRWIVEIAQGRPAEPEALMQLIPADLLATWDATRAATVRYLAGLTPESLRQSRVAPGDPAANETERNVPLAWIVWHVLERELEATGQIKMRLSE